jgi:ParB family transcriptional regulator, chromosome partitioning protein
MEVEFQHLDLRYERLRKRDPHRERQLLGSLADHGQQMPIVVVAGGGEARVVIDGYKRVRALQRLARDTVQATEWAVPEAEALIAEQAMRATRGKDALEQGWLLRELVDRFGLGQDELGRRFDKSKSWVSRRLALVADLPIEIQDTVRQGTLAAHAAMKYFVPLARANEAVAVSLAAKAAALRLSTRQVGALYVGYVSGSARTRELVLQDPRIFLRVQQESQQNKDGSKGPAQELAGELGALGGIARRLHRKVQQGLWARLARSEWAEIVPQVRRVRADVEMCLANFDEERADAGPEHARSDSATP